MENDYQTKILTDIDINDKDDVHLDESITQHKNIFEAANFFDKHTTITKEKTHLSYSSNLNRKFENIKITFLSGQKSTIKIFEATDDIEVFTRTNCIIQNSLLINLNLERILTPE